MDINGWFRGVPPWLRKPPCCFFISVQHRPDPCPSSPALPAGLLGLGTPIPSPDFLWNVFLSLHLTMVLGSGIIVDQQHQQPMAWNMKGSQPGDVNAQDLKGKCGGFKKKICITPRPRDAASRLLPTFLRFRSLSRGSLNSVPRVLALHRTPQTSGCPERSSASPKMMFSSRQSLSLGWHLSLSHWCLAFWTWQTLTMSGQSNCVSPFYEPQGTAKYKDYGYEFFLNSSLQYSI